jgi:hypothetical protein
MRGVAWARVRRLVGGSFGVLLVLLAAAGCGPGHGRVSGRVLYGGKPLPGSRVTFRPADPRQNAVSAVVDAEGNYSAVLPVGPVQASVDNRELEPRASLSGLVPPKLDPETRKLLGNPKSDKTTPAPSGAGPEKLPGKYVQIPGKYYAVETSGLDFTVTGGEQQHDLELTK